MNTRKPIGLQLFSVRKEVQEDLPGTLKEVARMGYDGVEFFGRYPHSPEEIRAMLQECGLQAPGYHVLLPWLEGEALGETIDMLKGIGVRYAVIAVLPEERRKTRQDWIDVAELMNGVSKKLAEHSIKLGYHNHRMEFERVDGELPFDLLFGNLDESVFMELDVGHALRGDADPASLIRKYPGRLDIVHVREYASENEKALVGEGEVDWADLLSLCDREGKTEWYVIEQSASECPPLEAAERCLRNLEGILEKRG